MITTPVPALCCARSGMADLLTHDQLELVRAKPTITVAQLPVSCDAVEVGFGHVQLGLERLQGRQSAAKHSGIHIAGSHKKNAGPLPSFRWY